MKYLPIIRKICQISILLFFCALPFLTAIGFTGLGGSLFSFDLFGIPFADPASTMQVIGQGLMDNILPLPTVLLGAAFSLILAFFMGRIFCGWICPYGLFSEFLGKRKRIWKYSNKLKTLIFAATLIIACLFSYPFISLLSMPGQISLSPLQFRTDWQAALLLLLPVFLALLLDLILHKRFFCSYICPQSVLLGAAAGLLPKSMPGLRIGWKKEKCSCKEAACDKACQFSLTPRKNPERSDCVMCGDCVAACAKRGGALIFSIKK